MSFTFRIALQVKLGIMSEYTEKLSGKQRKRESEGIEGYRSQGRRGSLPV